MKISIKRDQKIVDYEVELENITLLEALNHIKTKIDPTLTFDQGCRSGVCGSCGVVANNKEVLSCSYKVCDGDVIEPLRRTRVIRDLVVSSEMIDAKNTQVGAVSSGVSDTITDVSAISNQSDCILCGLCYSACPVYDYKAEFAGPFALTRIYRYVNDARELDIAKKIANIQNSGIWDCTLCNECVLVCPQNIAPKQDIVMLRNRSGVMGYSDPNMSFGGGLDFSF